MSHTLQTLKGFRDFHGVQAHKRMWLVGIFRKVFESYGFGPLETPALEYESLLLGKYGDEANKLIYSFEDRGGRRVAMRYDQTVPTARVVAQYQNELLFPYKRYQIQPVWRSEKPQKGRYREFTQCDIDIIGSDSTIADAQILAVTSEVMRTLDLPVVMKINDREQLIRLINHAGIPPEKTFSVIQTIDKLDKKSSSEVVEELREKGISQETSDELFKLLQDAKPTDKLAQIIRYAHSMGVPESALAFTPALARGLDYYTGMIFEPIVADYKSGSLGGGGRYDKLIEELVGVSLPATGMAFGFDRILEVLEALGKFPADLAQPARALITIFSEDSALYSTSIYRLLQKNNITVELYPHTKKKIEAQIKFASTKKIPFVVIAGEQEQQSKMVTIKDLATREQKTVDLPTLIQLLKNP